MNNAHIDYTIFTGILKAKIYNLALDRNFVALDTDSRIKYTDKMIEEAQAIAIKWSAEAKAA
jgi:hypothetical protein